MSDFFEILNNINSFNINYYKELPGHEKKKISLFLINRWLSGTVNKYQILDLNNTVNNRIFSFYNDQDLLYKLMCSVAIGRQRYVWLSRQKNSSNSNKIKVISEYYDCSEYEANSFLELLTFDEIIDMALSINADKELISKLKKEK